jgi:hypothetical protein
VGVKTTGTRPYATGFSDSLLEQAEAEGEPGIHFLDALRRQSADIVVGQVLVECAKLIEKYDGSS